MAERRIYGFIYNKAVGLKYWHPDVTARDCTNMFTMYRGLAPEADSYGQIFNIPVCIWIPPNYPNQAPMAYVEPTPKMQIMTSEYVDPNGVVTLDILQEWRHPNYDLLDVVQMMCVVFGEKPPVCTKQPVPSRQAPPVPARRKQPVYDSVQKAASEVQGRLPSQKPKPPAVKQSDAALNPLVRKSAPEKPLQSQPKVPSRPPPKRKPSSVKQPAVGDNSPQHVRQHSAPESSPQSGISSPDLLSPEEPLLRQKSLDRGIHKKVMHQDDIAEEMIGGLQSGNIKKRYGKVIGQLLQSGNTEQNIHKKVINKTLSAPASSRSNSSENLKPMEKSLYEIPDSQMSNLGLDDQDLELGSESVEDLYEELNFKPAEEEYAILEYGELNKSEKPSEQCIGNTERTIMKTCDKCSMLALMRCTVCGVDMCGICIAHHDADPSKMKHDMQNVS